MKNGELVMKSIIYDVDLAGDIKAFVLSNLDDISFTSPSFKKAILDADADDLLRVGKLINSPMNIVSVDKVDATFFKENLFKDGNQN